MKVGNEIELVQAAADGSKLLSNRACPSGGDAMNTRMMLNYLSDLEQNNNAEWFHENKVRYQSASGEFERLVDVLMLEFRKADDAVPLVPPKELTFKLQRDTRFSHDKSPYTPAFRAHIGPKGKLPIPCGYFVMLRPGGRSFLGGGLFADMLKDATAMVRSAIAAQGDEWERIVTVPSFTEYFTVGGAALKKVPEGYDPSGPQAEFLKNKSWYLEFPVPDDVIAGHDFVKYAVDIFLKMKPFNDFLNRALVGFEMPKR